MAGFSNEVVYADNVDFSGAGFPITGKVTADGELLIGSAVAPNIRVGTLGSSDSSITWTVGSGTITGQVAGGTTVGKTITGDTGGALSPTAGNWNILGQTASSTQVMSTIGSGSTLRIEDRTWTTAFVVDPSSTNGLRGTYSTIQSAINAASSGQDIFIRPGTYTENLTLKAGVNLTAFACDASNPSVTIVGKLSASFAGSASISGIRLQTNSDYVLEVTGTSATIIYLVGCSLFATNNSLINSTTTSTSAEIWLRYCFGQMSTTGVTAFSIAHGFIQFEHCTFFNTSNSTTASTTANDASAFFKHTYFSNAITTSGTAAFTALNSHFDISWNGTLTLGATGTNIIYTSTVTAGTATAISVGASVALSLANTAIDSSNAAAVAGAGTVRYAGVSFIGTSGVISTTTQTPRVLQPGAIKVTSPGAYPYTATPQDGVILVDTSSARTINLNASPATGQTYRIKDNVGSAAANNITITPAAGNIDGAASATINIAYGSIDVCYTGVQWVIL